ncbi:MAG: hypothetical protein WCG47_01585 [Dermatophilaceae bacterium]
MTKVVALIAGADHLNKTDLLRHGAMGRLFSEVRAPSTLGTFLRTFSFGHVRQLDAVAARFLVSLTSMVPVLAGADQVAFLDIDDMIEARLSLRRWEVHSGVGV